MTLLVLTISVPQISSHSVDIVGTELLKRLFDLWPKILSYAISFLILAIYWSGHHRQFHYIKHSDRVLVWVNNMRLLYKKNNIGRWWIRAIQVWRGRCRFGIKKMED
jgi:uncharacterized membrane protein